MNEQAKTISREELYERIWTTPIVQLAKELGFSYPELVQVCQRLNVPRPAAGHWYRLHHGAASERVVLPPPSPDMPLELGLGPRLADVAAVPAEPGEAGVAAGPSGDAEVKEAAVRDEAAPLSAPPEPTQELAEAVAGVAAPAPVAENQPEVREVQGEPKAQPPRVVEYSRRQLYDAIWSMPCLKFAASLGISDVALAKTCKRLGIPRPSLGYWARVTSGEKVPKIALPPAQPGQDRVMRFDVAANLERRKEWQKMPSLKGLEEVAGDLAVPDDQTPLHPLAEKHLHALEKAKAESDGFVRVSRRELFECYVSSGGVRRLCRALHALLVELEARGYKFRAGAKDYDRLCVVKGSDSVGIVCSEGSEQIEREPTPEDKRKPSWTWQLKETRPTGKLSFEIRAYGLRGRHTWSEASSRPLEEVLGVLAEKVDGTFRGFEEERRREAERAQERVEEEKRAQERRKREAELQAQRERERKERERLEKHQEKLAEIAEARRQNLSIAARDWIEAEGVRAFVEMCAARWQQRGVELTKEQAQWLSWARTQAEAMGPFAKGYPDPNKDGAFDGSKVPVGGPYPEVRELEDEEPVEPAPAEVKTVYVEQPRPPEQFPYWLLHRRR